MFRLSVLMIVLCISLPSMAAIIAGNPIGTVTLIEVYDYECPHCHDAYPVVETLIAHNPKLKVRLMPTAIINHGSIIEAAASLAATHYPGKFDAFNEAVLTRPSLSEPDIAQLLTTLGLSSPQFNQQMHSKSVEIQMVAGLELLKTYHSGTPLFIIYPSNNPNMKTVLKGYQPYATLQQAIDDVSTV